MQDHGTGDACLRRVGLAFIRRARRPILTAGTSRNGRKDCARGSTNGHLQGACPGNLSEIFGAEPPFAARGCFAQTWSVAEVRRAWLGLHAHEAARPTPHQGNEHAK
jgi:glycogen debranching enzyme